ncbi:MAG: acyltransferase [Clostridiales bacterium]|nr:acyltransferase [Clostridiales bacterium]
MSEQKKYNNLDGLRTMAALFIIIMHVLFCGSYVIGGGHTDSLSGYIVNHLITQCTFFVRLFFMISGFSMCCGYYEKIKNNQISLNEYYTRRYKKILPFFALLVVIDLLTSLAVTKDFTAGLLYEAFANLTLVFGLLPASEITVIGVGWTLGAIFGFYLLFPFFVWLIWDKKRAWIMLVISIAMNFACEEYFLINGEPSRCSTIHWLCYFIAGGIIYLYREDITRFLANKKILAYIMILAGLAIVYVIPVCNTGTAADTLVKNLRLLTGFAMVICGALMPDSKALYNPVSSFISKISLEIYLSHLFIFRIIEKLRLVHIFEQDMLSYITACLLVIAGVIMFASAYKAVEKKYKFF